MTQHFDGATYSAPRDGGRLNRQIAAVKRATADGLWWTLSELAAVVEAPEASVSARLRDLRKPRFGGYDVERKYMGEGLWVYRVSK